MTELSSRGQQANPPANLGQRIRRVLMPALAVFILLGGIALHSAVKNLLVSQFDYALLTKAQTLTRFPEPDRTGINLRFTERPLPEFHEGANAEYFQVWLGDGSVHAKSPSLTGDHELDRNVSADEKPTFWRLRLPDGRMGRAVGLRLSSIRGPVKEKFIVDLVIARGSETLDGLLRRLALGIVLAGGCLLGLAGYVVKRATVTALEPVSALAGEVGSIDVHSLKKRLPTEALPSDLKPIAEQINHLMARLEAAFDRERRFASNAAHELLTPVTELRVAAENALDWPEDAQATANLANDARDLTVQMEHVVRSLLALSRAEANLTPLKVERFDMAALVREILESAEPELTAHKLKVVCDLPERLELSSDPVLVRSILHNLLVNAINYSVAGSELKVLALHSNNLMKVQIHNRAEKISAEDVRHFGEPFWRGDKAHESREHSGLGLALSRAFAQLLRGNLEFQIEGTDVVAAVLTLPDIAVPREK